MPEGDVVWRTARELHSALAGRVLTRSDFRVPRFATVDLAGRAVLETVSRGKHLLTRVDGGITVHTHLRMDGSWRVRPTARGGWTGPAGTAPAGTSPAGPAPAGTSPAGTSPAGPAPAAYARSRAPTRDHQVRLILENSQWQAVGYLLGVVEVLRTDSEDRVVGHLGPDLLGPDWDAAEAVRRLRADPARPIGEAVVDQRNLAGIGNLYRAEVLFVRGISPRRPVGEVPDLRELTETAHRMLEANRERTTQVTTGNTARGQQTWVYGRPGRPCRRCGTPIAVAGRPGQDPGPSSGAAERVIFWCPSCQHYP